jgi:L-arabinokinase
VRTLRPVVYYITAHGYGHGVRSADILNAIARLAPEMPRIVVSALTRPFLESRLDVMPNRIESRALDVGMAQLDSIRIDLEASRIAAERLLDQWDDLVSREQEFLESVDAGCVVADIPAIPLEAAGRAGRPEMAVGNFSWSWIYEPFAEQDARWKPIVERFARAYSECDLLLRLPFAEPMTIFRDREDIGLLSTPAMPHREEIARLTSADLNKRWVLLSFSTLDWDTAALDRVESITDVEFFSVDPLVWPGRHIHAIDRRSMRFPEVLASVDAVASKPGYGIVSECIANRKPLLHSARRDFREYPILVEAIEAYLQHRPITEETLYSGDLSRELDLLWKAPQPRLSLPMGGAEVAARRILDLARRDH